MDKLNYHPRREPNRSIIQADYPFNIKSRPAVIPRTNLQAFHKTPDNILRHKNTDNVYHPPNHHGVADKNVANRGEKRR